MFDLKNKTAIVTGAARGIGESIAVELARAGANVVVSDVLNGSSTVKKVQKLKRSSMFIHADMSKEEDIKNLVNETIKKYKKIDILVNNAGVFIPGETLNVSKEDWDKLININLRGYFLMCREVLKHMKKNKQGSIINIASVAGLRGYSSAVSYCSSKGGIVLMTKSLAAEFSPIGIRINAICPGIIETPMTKDILADKKTKEGMLMKIPLRRTGKPIDIAGPAVFLASEASSYITGHCIVPDGGWTTVL